MNGALVVDVIRNTVTLTLLVAGPMLTTALVVGVLVSLVQTITQIQEQTLTFVPKLVAMAAVLSLSLPWLIRQLVEFLVQTFQSLPVLVS